MCSPSKKFLLKFILRKFKDDSKNFSREVPSLLNEIGEYEQYTLSPQMIAACEYPRLKYFTLIKRDFSGLERALTIVARNFLFNDDAPRTSDSELGELREILKAWCGFRNEAQNLPPHFDGWLVTYIRYAFLNEKINSCREKISCLESVELQATLTDLFEKFSAQDKPEEFSVPLAKLESLMTAQSEELKDIMEGLKQIVTLLRAQIKLSVKNKNFSKNLFGSLNKQGDTPFRAITYDRIIANALLAGKLRRYYLVCDDELFRTKKILKGTKKLSATDADMILKMTAEYLLQRRHTSQEFTETNDSNLMNWLVGSRKPENFARDSYVFADSGEKIFEVRKVNLGGINALKIKLHPDWTSHFILAEDGTGNYDSIFGRIFFSDAGSSEPLREGVKYS